MTDFSETQRALPLSKTGIRTSSVVLILFLIYLIGGHLRISIYSGNSLLVPMYLMLLSTAAIALLFFSQIFSRIGQLFLVLTGFVLIQPALSFANGSEYSNTLLGCLQLLASVFTALAVIYALTRVDPRRLSRILTLVWISIIILAVLESVALKPVFDTIRDALYAGSGRFVYAEALRDITIYGRVRTTVFASEPSFLADTLSALILMIFFLDPKRGSLKSWLRLGAMILISFAVSPSFKMAFYLLAVVVWQYWPLTLRGFAVTLISVILSAFLMLVFLDPLTNLVSQLAGNHLASGSFYGRIGITPEVGFRALVTEPIFGYGIGNETGAYPIISQAWIDSGAFTKFPWYSYWPAEDLMSNGFVWQWIFLGLAGGFIFNLIIVRLLRAVGVLTPFRTLITVWIVWYSGFAFVDPHSWFMMVVFSVGSVSRDIKLKPVSGASLSKAYS